MTLPVGSSLTPYSTPMHVYQLVLQLLRETFATMGGDDYPFRYTPDFETTRILVDTIYNKDSEAFGKKPLLVVSRGGIGMAPTVIGDRGTMNLRTSAGTYTTLVSSSVNVKVIGRTQATTDILANEVFNFLTTCRTLLPRLTAVHTVQGINLSEIGPLEQDDSLFVCIASLNYAMQYRWVQIDPVLLLKGIDFYVNEDLIYSSTYVDPEPEP
jgi:hypothetical protein